MDKKTLLELFNKILKDKLSVEQIRLWNLEAERKMYEYCLKNKKKK